MKSFEGSTADAEKKLEDVSFTDYYPFPPSESLLLSEGGKLERFQFKNQDKIGHMGSNGGMLMFVNSNGETCFTPSSPEKFKELQDAGYERTEDIYNPFSTKSVVDDPDRHWSGENPIKKLKRILPIVTVSLEDTDKNSALRLG